MHRYFSILHYVLNAKKRHGVHSPFIYSLSDVGFRQFPSKEEQEILNGYSHFLSNNTKKISIHDFGAGSKKHGQERIVKDIYKVSSSSKKYGCLLYQLAKQSKAKTILELGTNLSWGTLNLHLGVPDATIITVEGDPNLHQFSKTYFPKKTNIQFIHNTFEKYIQQLTNEVFDFIFIDGDHKGSSLLHYIDLLKKHSHNNTWWIFDDIRWSDDMWKTWESITQSKHWHVSIDLLRMGIVLARKQQEKEHFYLRF